MTDSLPFNPEAVAAAALARQQKDADRPLNGAAFHLFEDVPPPEGEDTYGQINEKRNGAPVIEILPPEFAEDAIALHFSSAYGNHLRFVDAWGRWYIWDRSVWRKDETLLVFDMVRRTCRSYSVNAPPLIQRTITSGKTISSVEKLARADRRHAATVDQWDADPWLLNTPAGIVDLRTREITIHDASHHMTKCTMVSPSDSGCPLWLKFLDRACNSDANLVAYLQRVSGYALTGSVSEHAMFFAYGTGRNGKGVFLNTLVSILGDYAMTADPDTFTASGAGKHLTVLARLQGARLVVAQETEEGVPWAEARVKSITGGDPITANFMRQDHFTYQPQFKLFMAGNHKPGLKSVDEAIRARFNLVPFRVTIPKGERDKLLSEKLLAEGPGILQWMIDGCWDWQQVGLKPPAIVSNATEGYFEAEDAMGLWLAEACIVDQDNVYRKTGATALYKSWKSWAFASGEPAMSQKRFGQALEARGFSRDRSKVGAEYVGISFIKNSDRTQPREND